jgi:NADH-quinone oxidoreductase subunit I
MRLWLSNIYEAVITVAKALWVSIRYWIRTYYPLRRTFTEHYEYPELPLVVAPRFRGFHRYDLTSCIACERCARDCPPGCIYIGKERKPPRKGFHKMPTLRDMHRVVSCGLHFFRLVL